MPDHKKSFLETVTSYVGHAASWLFLSEDGQGMNERRTEHASDKLEEARQKGNTSYAAPLTRFFKSPQLVVLDTSTLTTASISKLSSATEDPEARKPFDNFKNMMGLPNESVLSWAFKQDKKAYEDRKILADFMRPGKDNERFNALDEIIKRKMEEELPLLNQSPDDFCLYQWVHQLTMDIITEHVLGIHAFPKNAHFVLDNAEAAIVREGEPFHLFGYDIPLTESQSRYKAAKTDFLAFAKKLIDDNEEDILTSGCFLTAVLEIEAKNHHIEPLEEASESPENRKQRLKNALADPTIRKIISCAAAGLLFASGTLSTSLAQGLAYLNADFAAQLKESNPLDGKKNFWDAYFKEALRYTSSAAHNLRFASKDMDLKTASQETIHIPANSYIVLDHRRAHQNKETWGNPEDFDPNRFFADNAPDLHSPKFAPFSIGPRMCPGRQVAEVIFKGIISFLLEHHISFQLKDEEFKNIFNETYWTSKDFVTRIRSGKQMSATVVIDEAYRQTLRL